MHPPMRWPGRREKLAQGLGSEADQGSGGRPRLIMASRISATDIRHECPALGGKQVFVEFMGLRWARTNTRRLFTGDRLPWCRERTIFLLARYLQPCMPAEGAALSDTALNPAKCALRRGASWRARSASPMERTSWRALRQRGRELRTS